jgi:curved DNA-binding protein
MSDRSDYYKALGVSKESSQEEIKRAYRKLARKWHPDVNAGDADAEERFKTISEAYHVLGDAERRKTYDNVGPEQFAQDFDRGDFAQQFGSFFGGQRRGAPAQGGFGLFEELFNGGFGPGAQSQGQRVVTPARGRDIRVAANLTLEEAVRGTDRKVRYQAGDGGSTRTATVRIPAGAGDGTRIKVKGKGEAGTHGAAAGDLYLEVKLTKHPVFSVAGRNLLADVPVTVYEAALGATITVPTLDGTTRINLPAATSAGQRFRIRGQGAADSRSKKRGDLIVSVRIVLPERSEPGLDELMEQFRDDYPYAPRQADTVSSDAE